LTTLWVKKTNMRFTLFSVFTAFSLLLAACDIRSLNNPKEDPSSAEAEAAETKGGAGQDKTQSQAEENLQATGRAAAGGEVFAAIDPSGCTVVPEAADIYVQQVDGYLDLRSNPSKKPIGDGDNRSVDWVTHSPLDPVIGEDGQNRPYIFQFSKAGGEVVIWAKMPSSGPGVWVNCYYTLDGSTPAVVDGVAQGSTQIAKLNWNHNFPLGENVMGDWWKSEPIPVGNGTSEFKYKIGARKDQE
jgi:hypothetical protein